MEFEFKEDAEYFEKLLCNESQTMQDFIHLFDFRSVDEKRREFNKVKYKLKAELISKSGEECILKFNMCDMSSGIVIDHLIPLSTNQLNKSLRKLSAAKGKKVATQSFGSNHIDNLVIACVNCNNYKKHRILERRKFLVIFKEMK
jgi:5-methylcytosine-specific restriction endonuclease McrA